MFARHLASKKSVRGDGTGSGASWISVRGAEASTPDLPGIIEDRRPVASPASRLVVWFDGSCPLCLREIGLIRRLDRSGAIDFIDVATAQARDCPIDRRTLLARFHAREDGRLLSGAAAFAAMWRAIPVLRPLGLAARNTIMLALLERLYRVFLTLRPGLQRLAVRLFRR